MKMTIFKEGNSLCRVAISGKKKKKKQKLFFQMLDPDNYKAVHLLGLLGKTGLIRFMKNSEAVCDKAIGRNGGPSFKTSRR